MRAHVWTTAQKMPKAQPSCAALFHPLCRFETEFKGNTGQHQSTAINSSLQTERKRLRLKMPEINITTNE
jgi:hypothetical protein